VSAKTRNLLIAIAAVGLMAGSAFVPQMAIHSPGPVPEGEHWSLLTQFFPGLLHNVTNVLEPHKTYLANESPSRVSHVFMALLVAVIIIILALLISFRLRKDAPVVPDRKLTVLSLMETGVEAILSLMEGVMGRKNAIRYFPLIGALGGFILFSNLLGMIPGFVPPTDTLSTTLALGTVVFLATHFFGIREHGIAYFKHFLGPIVKWYALPLMALMFVIEMISHLVRPCSLAVRLMGTSWATTRCWVSSFRSEYCWSHCLSWRWDSSSQ